MKSMLGLAIAIVVATASGCASDPVATSQEPRSAPAYRTGSMVPKKDRDTSDAVTVDPQAVRDALGGKPPGQPSTR